jgi:Protein of unknown function (DUF3307)
MNMSWVELFAAFAVSHLVGDYLFQTDWQARHKRGGLHPHAPVERKALLSHVFTYTIAFLPIVLIGASGAQVAWVLALIAVPHLIQDDGTLLAAYMRRVKGVDPAENLLLSIVVDQTFHMLALLGLALLLSAA